jgi:hypothetical protein
MNITTITMEKFQSIAIAKRWFGARAQGSRVDCMQREFDNLWEMIKLIPDPSLSDEVLADLKQRNVPHPYRWVTVAVVEPFVVEGIIKSLNRGNEDNDK